MAGSLSKVVMSIEDFLEEFAAEDEGIDDDEESEDPLEIIELNEQAHEKDY